MQLQRLAASFVALTVVTACASVSTNPPSAIAPQLGPKATIYASYSGGIFDRSVHAWFRVDRPAHVVVAHLSGEGVIRVLYPESPRDTGLVADRKALRTVNFLAPYDAVPSLYSFRPATLRSHSARVSSYDGIGHAYIFMIASREPLNFDAISQSGLWDEMEVPEYDRAYDPRIFARDFADLVAEGEPYTLTFAQSYTTSAFMSYASRQMDCFALSTMPLVALSSLGYYYGYRSYCPGAYYSLLDYYVYGPTRRYTPGWPVPVTPVAVVPPRKPDTTNTAPTLPTRLEGDTITIVPPRPTPRRDGPLGPPAEAPAGTTRSRLADGEEAPAGPRPRRQTLEPSESSVQRFDRPRPILYESPSRTSSDDRVERPRRESTESSRPVERSEPARTERSEPVRERYERPQPTRAETPAPSQPAPAPRASEPASPPPPPPPRPRPDQP